MAIKIGHSSIDENGKTINGVAGDQTQKEVCIRTWYSKPWGFVLRCKDSSIAEKMAKACEDGCTNDKIGYDQNQRNTAHTQAKSVGYDLSKITVACECDCSSFMTLCAIAGGITELEYTGNAPTTSTMQSKFMATGKFELLTDSKYLTSDKYLKRGDILVKSGSHTAMALENGEYFSASSTNTQSELICIDVSSYQGTIDWDKVKAFGIKYAILRGVIKNGTLDTSFEQNYKNATANGVSIIGVYQFSYALDENTAQNDAANMISKLNGKKIDIYLDLEWSTQRNLGKTKVTSIAKAYVNTCKSLGYTCHIYSNLDWYKNVYDANTLSNLGCKFWIARYPSSDDGTIKENLKPNIGEHIWQYSSKGNVNGINGNVDMNVIYGDIQASINSSTSIPSESAVEIIGKINTQSGNLNIRKEPTSASSKLGSYKKGELVQIIAKTNTGWYKTDKGYISSDYVIAATGKVYNCTKLNIRKEAKVSDNVIKILNANDVVYLLNESGTWYKVKTEDNVIGYVSQKYISIL